MLIRNASKARKISGIKPQLLFHPDHRKRSGIAPLHAERLYEMIGVERTLSEVERTIRAFVLGEEPPVRSATHFDLATAL